MNTRHLVAMIGLTLWACATTTAGSAPHEMSALQHEAAAKQEEEAAAGHAAQHDPNVAVSRERCSGGSMRTRDGLEVCWTSVTNPTDAHLAMAEEHRRHAADHRAGSAALRDAEARACVGVPEEDRDMSPFERVQDIASVTPLSERRGGGKQSYEQTVGATVTFRAVPGMTAEWLQRVIDCHLARNAALGHSVAEMPNCPLVPNGATATVSSTGKGFAVAIRSDDPAVAKEILARAERSQAGRQP